MLCLMYLLVGGGAQKAGSGLCIKETKTLSNIDSLGLVVTKLKLTWLIKANGIYIAALTEYNYVDLPSRVPLVLHEQW